MASIVSSHSKQDLLMSSLSKFYTNQEHVQEIISIITGKSKISLRVIDWFVTNYSKKNNISYILTEDNKIVSNIDNISKYREFIVYIDYKLQLKGYQKKQFDPFCRRSRINYYYAKNKYFVTTVGQLNFFRWAIKNGIITYITDNLKNIEDDMNKCYKAVYSKKNSPDKKKSSRRKRQELSISATKKLNKSNIKIVVSFD
tara:strand:- start:361 stop:960 length:600 start_codon:yes stop_codon:yes gene_type:complete